MHPSITVEEIALVERRMGVNIIDPATGKSVALEDAYQWFNRNANDPRIGEEQAVIWFKEKAAKQARIEAEANKHAG